MARKFVRNITGTKLTGDVQEPLDTNMQNDLLSNEEDVFVRNKDEYHCLTDNIKDVTSKNDVITVNKTGKNSIELVGKETKIVSKNDKLIVKKNATNDYELEVTVQGGEGGGDVYGVESKTPETLKVNKNTTDKVYELSTDLSGYATKEDLEDITPTPNVPVKIDSKTPTILKVDKNGENDFSLTADLKDYATKEDLEDITPTPNVPVVLNSTNETLLVVTKNSENNFTLEPLRNGENNEIINEIKLLEIYNCIVSNMNESEFRMKISMKFIIPEGFTLERFSLSIMEFSSSTDYSKLSKSIFGQGLNKTKNYQTLNFTFKEDDTGDKLNFYNIIKSYVALGVLNVQAYLKIYTVQGVLESIPITIAISSPTVVNIPEVGE